VRSAYGLVDEIWCASEHVRHAVQSLTDRPVLKHPLVIDLPSVPTMLTRADLSLPQDRFVFGFSFDYRSVLARKNPLGLISAYQAAFGPDDGAALVLKTINSADHANLAAWARETAGTRPDIVFLDAHFDQVRMRAFFELIDCYVSLHRSEGLGLTIASAMGAGTPVIATGWSGNLEFMDDRNSVLVPYELVEVGPGCDPYASDAIWAEPDLDVAAEHLRRMFEDREHALAIGGSGRASLIQAHSLSSAASWFEERYGALTGVTAA
jgi:glycosyltransferase involved in cell wall biosynthesis